MDQVVEAALAHGTSPRAEAEARAAALFQASSACPIPKPIGERFPHQVSGGQLQRAMTAMAMCSEPDLIVFDEPTTALDVTTQIEVLAAIKDAIRDTDVAALYITHDLAVVAQIADQIMVLRHGKLVEWGDTRQIIKEPRQEYTNALVSVHEIDHAEQKPGDDAVPVGQERRPPPMAAATIKVLKDVSVDIHPGQTLAVVGESGSGKSTLARAITGLLPPQDGTVTFDGKALPGKLGAAQQGRAAPAADDLPDGRCRDEPAPDRAAPSSAGRSNSISASAAASATSASPSCSTRSSSASVSSTAIRRSFPAARSSASASPGRSPPSPS